MSKITAVVIALILLLGWPPSENTQLSGNTEQLQKVQQLNARLDELSERCTQLEQQNVETLKRWKDIEGSYKSMYEVFNYRFGSDINVVTNNSRGWE